MNYRNMLRLADFAEVKFGDTILDMRGWDTCLVGQAAQCNVFRGLEFHPEDKSITYKGDHDWEAARRLFGVTLLDAVLMFDGYTEMSGHTIASEIRKRVKSEQGAQAA